MSTNKAKLVYLLVAQLVEQDGFNQRVDYGNIKELAVNIEENGLTTPLLAIKTKEKNDAGLPIYHVTDGHRRLRALKELADDELQVAVIEQPADTSDHDRFITQVVTADNKPLNLLEQGLVYQQLKNSGMLDADIARKVGKSQTHIADCLLLTTANKKLKEQITKGKISATEVLDLLKGEGADETEKIVEKAIADKGGKKVTKKDIKKSAGKEVGAKAKSSAGKSNKANPVKEDKAPDPNAKVQVGKGSGTSKEAPKPDALAKLKKLQDAIEDQDAPKKPEAVKLLKKIMDWLEGRIDSGELTPFFFKEEPVEVDEDEVE